MRSLHLPLIACLLGAPMAAQEDILHYDFRANTGDSAANLARGARAGPASGKLLTSNTTTNTTWEQGRHDYALAGADWWDATKNPIPYNYIDTGWKTALKGSFTIAWFMKRRHGTPTLEAHYLFGRGSLRGFMRGRALQGFSLAGWGGNDYLDLTQDLDGMAASRWVHVALVVDDAKGVATYYLDGARAGSTLLYGKVDVPEATEGFRIGAHERLQTSSYWSIDEFRLIGRALSDFEIKGLTTVAEAYGKGCGASLDRLDSTEPIVGTDKFKLRLRGAANTGVLMAIGLSADKLWNVLPLPLDLEPIFGVGLKGCQWQTSLDFIVAGSIDASGIVDMAFPLPADDELLGLTLYTQCFVLTLGTNRIDKVETSNGYLFTVVPKPVP